MCRSYIWAGADGRIKYVDSIETETHVYIATERVRPLQSVLRDTDLKGKAKEEWIGWGVKSISVSDHVLAVLTIDRCSLFELAVTSSRIHQPQLDIHYSLYGMAFRRAGPPHDKGRCSWSVVGTRRSCTWRHWREERA